MIDAGLPTKGGHAGLVRDDREDADVEGLRDRLERRRRGDERDLAVCGEGAVQDGQLQSFRRVTSLAIRLPRAVPGVARPLIPQLLEGGRLASTLILSPPGLGKTTLLRDLIRCISSGDGLPPLRVGVADERGELGAGNLRYDLGPRTDVLEK